MNFITVDFETANSKLSSACSLGLVLVENGKLVEKFHYYIKPYPYYFNARNVMIHGIKKENVVDSPDFLKLWKDIKYLFKGNQILAHNASFDMSVLRACLDAYDLTYPKLSYYCTYRLSESLLDLENNRLPTVAESMKIRLKKHHDALSDSEATAKIGIKLMKKFKVNDLDDLTKLVNYRKGEFFPRSRSYNTFSRNT